MTHASIQAIETMVAPVVLMTSAGILAGGISTMYGAVNDRMRAMTAERLDLLCGPEGTFLDPDARSPRAGERLGEIDAQVPGLLLRHRMLHHAVLLCYASVLLFVASVVAIAVSVTGASNSAGTTSLVLVLAGTVILLAGLAFAARSVLLSQRSIDYEVARVMALGG